MNKLNKAIEEAKEKFEKERKIPGFDYGRLRHDNGIVDGLMYAKRLVGTCSACKHGKEKEDVYVCTKIDSSATVWTTKDSYCGHYKEKDSE